MIRELIEMFGFCLNGEPTVVPRGTEGATEEDIHEGIRIAQLLGKTEEFSTGIEGVEQLRTQERYRVIGYTIMPSAEASKGSHNGRQLDIPQYIIFARRELHTHEPESIARLTPEQHEDQRDRTTKQLEKVMENLEGMVVEGKEESEEALPSLRASMGSSYEGVMGIVFQEEGRRVLMLRLSSTTREGIVDHLSMERRRENGEILYSLEIRTRSTKDGRIWVPQITGDKSLMSPAMQVFAEYQTAKRWIIVGDQVLPRFNELYRSINDRYEMGLLRDVIGEQITDIRLGKKKQ